MVDALALRSVPGRVIGAVADEPADNEAVMSINVGHFRPRKPAASPPLK